MLKFKSTILELKKFKPKLYILRLILCKLSIYISISFRTWDNNHTLLVQLCLLLGKDKYHEAT